MYRIHVLNKNLNFYKEEDIANQFIDEALMDGVWGDQDDVQIKMYEWKSTRQIMQDIFRSCGSQEQQFRIISGLDVKSSFATILNDDNYPLARYKMQECMMEGKITAEDMGIIDSVLPSGEVIYEY